MYGCLLIHSRKCSKACSFRFSSSRSSSFAFTRNLSDSIAAKLFYTQKWEMKRNKDEKLWNSQNSRTRRRLCRVGFRERPKTLKLCLAWFESIYAEKTFSKFRFQHVTGFHQWPGDLALPMHCKVSSRTFIACSTTDLRFSIFDSSIAIDSKHFLMHENLRH